MGFKVRSRRTWVKAALGGGWVVADFGGNRHNTREVGEWSVIVWGWPPGTWERQGLPAPEPDSRVAPLYAGPESVLGWMSGRRPDVVELVAGMTDEQIAEGARVLLDYTRAACTWVEARHQDLRG